ncbi:MAG TPA: S9 family peptidase [Parafilimonas sp.]|nr:S9 family peptidase [Parafilimonas sp.]
MKLTNLLLIVCIFCSFNLFAQPPAGLHWSVDGNSYYEIADDGITKIQLPSFTKTIIATAQQLTPKDSSQPLKVRNFFFSNDGKKVLIYTNSKKVWRLDTRGDYWVLNTADNSLKQLGKSLPSSSLMFAKFSPDGNNVAYVSKHNLYVEDLASNNIKPLTTDGTDRMINGTFDWVYEEELGCRDGFRWSPDSKSIAYWKIDATKIPNFLMINNTDSIYSHVVPVEYPTAGTDPSPCYVYVANIATGNSTKMNVPGDPQQHYIPRMEWAANSTELVIQQLDRRQNESKVMYCNAATGDVKEVYDETDKAWIDIKAIWAGIFTVDLSGWEWIKNGNAFLWVSEKDGWRHMYAISRDGKTETLITKGNYDIISLQGYDEKSGYVYFMASPDNATQSYLYRIKMDGKSAAERLSPAGESGTHNYDLSPNGLYASHTFSNINTPPVEDWVSLPKHTVIKQNDQQARNTAASPHAEMFKVTTDDGVTMDGWMVKPTNFDSTKKYPVVFYVYTEPWTQLVIDRYGVANNFLYNGDMAADGYIYICVDNRGTLAPKGVAWRKIIYRNIGRLNIHDQAMAAKKILQWPFVDTSRVAVWGWSGGGSATLNCILQYPEIYKTGISIAAVDNLLTYDNIYEERYMGLPQENMKDYVAGSPITYAKNLQGHLLIVHGTGDDNVHYQNAEMMINELIKYNKIFQFMPYPNRTHSISEGEGTRQHLSNLYTTFLRQYCPPGGR